MGSSRVLGQIATESGLESDLGADYIKGFGVPEHSYLQSGSGTKENTLRGPKPRRNLGV